MSIAKQIARRLAEGASPAHIAADLGCSRRYVYETKRRVVHREKYLTEQRERARRKRRAAGAKPKSEILWPSDLHRLAVHLKNVEGLSASQIAKITGKTRSAVIGHLWRTGA